MAQFLSYSVLLLLLISQLQLCSSEPLALTAIGAISGVLGIIEFVWGKIKEMNEVQGEESDALSIYDLKSQLNLMTEEIIKAVHDANKVQTLKDRIHEATDAIDQIDSWYYDMVIYNKTDEKDLNIKIRSEAHKRLLNGPEGPEFYLRDLYKLFYYEGEENIFQLIASIKQGYAGTCSTGIALESVQQIFQKLYIWGAISSAKTYLTVLMASQIIKTHNHDVIIKHLKNKILQYDEKAIKTLKHYMQKASRVVWRCDPDEQIEDVTYTELKRLFQKFIIQEHDLGENYNNCLNNCEDYKKSTTTDRCNPEFEVGDKEQDQSSPPATLCTNQRTCRKILNCEFLGIEYRLWDRNDYLYICNSDQNSSRRYDYLEKRKGDEGPVMGHWGQKEKCNNFTSHATPHRHGRLKCDLCICTCSESDDPAIDSDAYISLESLFSNTNENRVLTGVRFVKKQNTIRIEIEEGTLGKMGTIVNNSASWVTRDYSKPTKRDVDAERVLKISWDAGRRINLHDLHAPKNEIIFGLQLLYDDNHGLHLSIFTRPFDFYSGKLLGPGTVTLHPIHTDKTINLDNCNVPILSPRKSSIIETNKVLDITVTGLKEDIGQTVIPFWDTQEVTSTIRTPMTGIGLYYKTFGNYGGFLGLKLYTFDIEPHIKYEPERTFQV